MAAVALIDYVYELWLRFRLARGLFKEQRVPFFSKARFIAILTSRRSGKTVVAIFKVFDDCLKHPGKDYAYLARTKEHGAMIAWAKVIKFAKDYEIDIVPHKSDLCFTLPGGGTFYLFGADQKNWLNSFRGIGDNLRGVLIDEAGHYSNVDMEKFIIETVRPTLVDNLGFLWIFGTPGENLTGFWWDHSRPDDKRLNVYELHEWGTFDNPHMVENIKLEIALLIEQYGPSVVKLPWFLREWGGKWVSDPVGNIYDFDWDRNVVEEYPREIGEAGENYVLSLDFGHSDAYAETLHGWNDYDEGHYVIESFKRGMHVKLGENWMGDPVLLDEVAERVRDYHERYPGLVVVADNASRQLLLNLSVLFDLVIHDAEKTDKMGAIRVMNTMLAAGIVKVVVKRGVPNALAEELATLKKHWRGAVWVELSSQSNDCADTLLYGYRRTRHYDTRNRTAEIKPGSVEYFNEIAKRLKASAAKRASRRKR